MDGRRRLGLGLTQTRLKERIARDARYCEHSVMTEPVVERSEIVALLSNVSDIAVSLKNIEQLLEDDNGEERDEG